MTVHAMNRQSLEPYLPHPNADHYLMPGKENRGPMPRVTSILDIMSKGGLVNWAAKVEREAILGAVTALLDGGGQIRAEAIKRRLADDLGLMKNGEPKYACNAHKERAADIGTQAHRRLEAICQEMKGVKTRPEDWEQIHPAAAKAAAAGQKWLLDLGARVIETEQRVWSESCWSAGTLDLLIEANLPGYGECRIVSDWKTSKAIYLGHVVQGCAYRYFLQEMGHLDDSKPVLVAVLRLPKAEKDPPFEVKIIPPERTERYFNAFKLLRRVHAFLAEEEAGGLR